MTGPVRSPLDARPELQVGGHVHTPLDDGGLGRVAEEVRHVPVDAVVVDDVSGADGVGVVGEGPVVDALVGPRARAAEAEDGIEDDGLGEGACIKLFLPVSGDG